jgi:hypothetical protein
VDNRSDDNLLTALHAALSDDSLLTALQQALSAREAVPPDFVAAARNAYAWHTIDAELARLTYDSSQELAAGLRSESASIRALSFISARLSIEVEITGDTLLGQLIPAQQGTVEVYALDGSVAIVAVDEAGCFAVEPKPGSPFRLRCHAGPQTDVLTGWVTL